MKATVNIVCEFEYVDEVDYSQAIVELDQAVRGTTKIIELTVERSQEN